MARKTKRTAQRKKKTARTARPARTAAVPSGMHTDTPYLVINGAGKAIEFYKKAFGAKEVTRQPMPDGTLMHAMIKIGDSLVMMSDEFPGSDTKSPINAGAKPTMPLENHFWGERYGKLQDPFGHIWSVAMVVKMSEAEKEAKRQAAFGMFEKREHPGFESKSM